MKTERRHELQHNQLADWIGSQAIQVQHHRKTILAAVILGSAVLIAAFVILSDRKSAQAAAWTEFNLAFSSRDPVALADVAKRHSGTTVALWARQAQADLDLNRGIAALYSNREDAMQTLSEARKAYTEVIAGAASYPEILQHALFGLAQAQEATGNLDGAREYYQQVVQKFPDSAMAQDSVARLAAIKNPEVAKWYNWFSKQKPRPSSPLSMPNLPGMPDDLTKLPEMPNLPPAPEGGPVAPPAEVPPAEVPTGVPPAGIPLTPPTTPTSSAPAPATPGAPNPDAAKKPETPEVKPAVPAPEAASPAVTPPAINPPANPSTPK